MCFLSSFDVYWRLLLLYTRIRALDADMRVGGTSCSWWIIRASENSIVNHIICINIRKLCISAVWVRLVVIYLRIQVIPSFMADNFETLFSAKANHLCLQSFSHSNILGVLSASPYQLSIVTGPKATDT
jgi:hypothetical protein